LSSLLIVRGKAVVRGIPRISMAAPFLTHIVMAALCNIIIIIIIRGDYIFAL